MTVLLIAEHEASGLRKATRHAITAARELAERVGAPLHLALLGQGLDAAGAKLSEFGGAAVHLCDAAALEHYLAETHAEAVETLARRLGARWVLAPATAMGKDLLPRVAVRLAAGMASDVVGFEGEGEGLRLKRPMWAGDVMAELEIATPIKVVTVRPTEFAAALQAAESAPVVREPVELKRTPRTRFVAFAPVKTSRPVLTEARVVVAGGQGTHGDFRPVEALADALGGAVGASRKAVDAGWIANEYQVGQTGKVVAPELYIAAGISGSVQHVAGMKGSRVIVAVNTNPEAPIFQVADYGIVGDLATVLPELTAALKKEG